MADPGSMSMAAAIERAAVALATDPAAAEQLARRILAAAPSDPRARLIVGSARRRLGDPAAARAILEPLARAFPRAANTQYELGASLAALGDSATAIAALRQATAVNRDLAEAWRLLGELLFQTGDVDGADRAFAEHERAAVRDPALRPAAEALFRGDLAEAETLLRGHIETRPSDIEALRLLAGAFNSQGRYGDAESLLARALEADPTHDGVRFSYAETLFRQQQAQQALFHVERLLSQAPQDAAYRNLKAACLGLLGEDERMSEIYAALLADFPKTPKIWLNYGHVLRSLGRGEEAVMAYRQSLALAPGLGDAYWSLANLKVAAFSADDAAAMAVQLERADLGVDDGVHLHYALGKALEDRGDYAASFSHYAVGAALRRNLAPYDPGELTRAVDRHINLFTDQFFADRPGVGSEADDPVFIVGLPRSGSTLIEQILASHSQVEGTMELPDLGFVAKGLGEAYPENLAGLDAQRLAALGERYLATTRVHRRSGRRFFIDKMPNNFHRIGLIQLILPRAKIIDARRHPLGSCFSAFKQHFAQGQDFSYDLADLGLYYRDYVRLMAHFDAVLPDRIHRVIYEDLVEDTEGQVRRLLAHCGLPFEDGCLRFYENDRAVRTVSSEQVRQPIFRQGLDQWRRYEPWLDPLKAALGPVLDGWRG